MLDSDIESDNNASNQSACERCPNNSGGACLGGDQPPDCPIKIENKVHSIQGKRNWE